MKELTKEQTDKIFSTITANGCREMEEDRFHQAVNEAIHISRQLEPSVEPEIVEIEETELFDKEVLIGGDLGYANKTRTKAITISDYGDGYRIRQYVSNGDMDWQRVGNIPMQLPVKPDFCDTLKNHIKTMVQSRENAKDEEGNIYLGCKIQLLTLNHLLIYIDGLSKNLV